MMARTTIIVVSHPWKIGPLVGVTQLRNHISTFSGTVPALVNKA